MKAFNKLGGIEGIRLARFKLIIRTHKIYNIILGLAYPMPPRF
jgi:hypothetical protein